MLFVGGKINGVHADIFVDTGAQTTVISEEFAKRADLLNIIDKWQITTVIGVG